VLHLSLGKGDVLDSTAVASLCEGSSPRVSLPGFGDDVVAVSFLGEGAVAQVRRTKSSNDFPPFAVDYLPTKATCYAETLPAALELLQRLT
jgi:hypothetical protein